MAVTRRLVGEPIKYKGHRVEARYMGPDLLCYVDGREVGHFYLNAEAARKAGRDHVDQLEKEKAA